MQPKDPGIVAVVVALPPDQAAAAGGQHSAKDRLLLGGGRAAQAASLAPVVQDVRMEAELGGSLVEAGMEGAGSEAGPPGYRVVFHTSRICGSGTKAKVGSPPRGETGSECMWHGDLVQLSINSLPATCLPIPAATRSAGLFRADGQPGQQRRAAPAGHLQELWRGAHGHFRLPGGELGGKGHAVGALRAGGRRVGRLCAAVLSHCVCCGCC